MASKKPAQSKDGSLAVECPHCTKKLFVPLKDLPKPALSQSEIQDLIKKHAPAAVATTEDHRHNSFDQFLDCPECRLWAEKTGKRYKFTDTSEKPPAAEPKPAQSERPPIGSIFKVKESKA